LTARNLAGAVGLTQRIGLQLALRKREHELPGFTEGVDFPPSDEGLVGLSRPIRACARARPVTAARAGLDLGAAIAGEALRCPQARNVSNAGSLLLRLETRHDQRLQRDRAAVGAGVLVALFVPPLVFAPVPQP
jgi:hypothetical protein